MTEPFYYSHSKVVLLSCSVWFVALAGLLVAAYLHPVGRLKSVSDFIVNYSLVRGGRGVMLWYALIFLLFGVAGIFVVFTY